MRKKLSILSLILIFVLMFSACGKSSEKSTEQSSKKKLTILTSADWNPFEYLDNGKIVGFDIDLIKALSKEAGYSYQLKNVSWDAMFTQLKGNSADMGISGITITNDRKQTYDFSIPYFISKESILVKKGSIIKSGSDLKGKVVAVEKGSVGQTEVEKILGQNDGNIKRVENTLRFMELVQGNADATVGDDTSNQKFVLNNPKDNLKAIQDEKNFTPENFGLMFPKNSKIKSDYNKAINKLFDDGEFSKIYKKWFKTNPDIKSLKALQK